MLNNIEENKIVFPESISIEARTLITCLLEKNPVKRLGASQRDG